jgi:uncharacterized protein YjiS (DUF1127 family)
MRPGKTLARPQIFLPHFSLQGPIMFYDTSSTARPRRPGLMAIAARPWQMLANLMLQRQTRAALSGLSNHMLKDIGVSRGSIPHISRNASPARSTRFGR